MMIACRRSIFACRFLYAFFGLQIFIIGLSAYAVPKEKGNCTYAVTIETSCTLGAGTSDHVSLRFGDLNSNDILVRHLNTQHVRRVDPLDPQILDDVPRKPFQPCVIDQFEVKGSCVESPICYLYLKLAGNDDWRPGFAQVRVVDLGERTHLSSGYFYFRRYLPRRAWFGSDLCAAELTPFGMRHKRKVFAKVSEN